MFTCTPFLSLSSLFCYILPYIISNRDKPVVKRWLSIQRPWSLLLSFHSPPTTSRSWLLPWFQILKVILGNASVLPRRNPCYCFAFLSLRYRDSRDPELGVYFLQPFDLQSCSDTFWFVSGYCPLPLTGSYHVHVRLPACFPRSLTLTGKVLLLV